MMRIHTDKMWIPKSLDMCRQATCPIKTVNVIRAKGIFHSEFQEFDPSLMLSTGCCLQFRGPVADTW